MERGAISFMEVEGVLGNELVVERHQAIAEDLGHDGSARDDVAAAVSAHERPAGSLKRRDRMTVHEQKIRRLREIFSRRPHRLERCAEDVAFVDLPCAANAEADFGAIQNDHEGPLTLRGRQPLGIVDVNGKRGGSENDRRRDDRTGQRTAARFIQAGDPAKTRGADELIRCAE